MYVITYAENGTIMSVGKISDELAKTEPAAWEIYMKDLPEPPEGRPFRKTYKVLNGQLVYDPTPDEEPQEEEVTYE